MTSYFSSTKPLHMIAKICLWAGQYDGLSPQCQMQLISIPMGGMEWWNGFFSGDLFFSGIFFFIFFSGWWKFLAGSGKLYAEYVSYVYTGLYCTATLSCLAGVFSMLSIACTTGQKPWVSFPMKCILSAVSCLSVPMPSRSVGKVIKNTKDG